MNYSLWGLQPPQSLNGTCRQRYLISTFTGASANRCCHTSREDLATVKELASLRGLVDAKAPRKMSTGRANPLDFHFCLNSFVVIWGTLLDKN
eukprot:5388869-Amphidinium_carterae.1